MQLLQPAPVESAPLKLVELPLPEPAPAQLRIRVEACGVCHTDLHEIEGDLKLPRLPLVVGHEIIGIVDQHGPGVNSPPPGTRVGIAWLGATCGRCSFCTSGRENLCEDARFTGLHIDGGYARYTIAHAGFCYPLPPGLSAPAAAPLLCAGVIGYRALRIALVFHRLPAAVGLYGFGASAHIVLQILKHWHCPVAVFTRTPGHQEHARELGADWVGAAQHQPPFKLDAGIIFAPAGELVPLALNHLNRGGTLALAGIHMSQIPALDYSLIYQEHTIRSITNSTRQDVLDLLQLAQEIPIQTTVTTFPLEQANEALQAIKHSRLNGAAVLLIQ